MDRLRAYLAELATAERYAGYWLTLNQAGHTLVGAALAGLIHPLCALLGYLAWETWQQHRGSRVKWSDSLTDAAYVALGVALVVALGQGVAIASAVILAITVTHGVVTQK